MRVKRKNSEFKILNFKSYKKFYFHCSANDELKPHAKVLKNLVHNMTLKKHLTTIFPSYITKALTQKIFKVYCNAIRDNVTQIKCSIFERVWLLKNLLFFKCLYFSEYDIRMLLFIFWLRNRTSIKYVRSWGNGGEVIKNV